MDAPVPPVFITADVAPVAARFRESPEDFEVEEVPLYVPSGEGPHLYLRVEKRGISTHEAARRLAFKLGRRERDAGYAGLKDARAVARQWISLDADGPTLEAAAAGPEARDALAARLSDDRVRVLEVSRHRNKLKLGHLRGNRFRLRLRGVAADGAARARAVLERLAASGAPNFYGEQRFGTRHDTQVLGRALLAGEAAAVVGGLLGGDPAPSDGPRVREARARFRAGDPRGALAALPHAYAAERAALGALARGADDARAVAAIPKRFRALYVSAYQADLFNRLLADRARAGTIGALEAGDVAWIHASGACFVVDDPGVQQPRAAALEVSPAGPLFGTRLLEARAAPGAREAAVLAAEGLSLSSFRIPGLDLRGARRPYRIPVADLDVGALGAEGEGVLVLSFALPPGCYATAVIAEVMKPAAGP